MRFKRPWRPEPAPTVAEAEPVVMRFATHGGAAVEVLETEVEPFRYVKVVPERPADAHDTWQPEPVTERRKVTEAGSLWRCRGCLIERECHTSYRNCGAILTSALDRARDEANEHAGNCRSMPHPPGPAALAAVLVLEDTQSVWAGTGTPSKALKDLQRVVRQVEQRHQARRTEPITVVRPKSEPSGGWR